MKQRTDERRRGAALFVVLMFAVIIADLALLALHSSSSEIRATGLFVDAARAEELGESLVPLTRHYISRDIAARLRGGSFTAQFPDATVRVDYLSESARVDVNRSPIKLLEAVLLREGLSRSRVAVIASGISRRRFARPANLYESPFEVDDDWNLSEAEAKKIVPLLTTANVGGRIDPLLAGTAILSVLFDGSAARVAQFREKRMIGFLDEETARSYFSEPVEKWITFGADRAVRAIARVTTRRGLRRRFEAVFDARGKGPNGKIYYWRSLG